MPGFTGMKIIAKGVETQEQLDYLCLQNVPQIQGYYFYKPMAAKDFASLLAPQIQIFTVCQHQLNNSCQFIKSL